MDNSADSSNHNSKATFDPGWNDPPTFSYTATQTPPNRPRNFLNKRVAFPISGTNISPVVPSVKPPIPAVVPVVPQAHVQSTENYFENIDSEQVLNDVKTILLELLEQSVELGHKSSDIKRRLSVMEDMWNSGKLNLKVQLQMKELSVALKQDEPHRADEIHRALMVDHVSSVGSWMPGIKQLIHNCISRSELLSIEKQ